MRQQREQLARRYQQGLADVEEIELPPWPANRLHSWHLYPIRLRLDRLSIARDGFLEELRQGGVAFSVHWRPLHLHDYYLATFGWRPIDCPAATVLWPRLVSLPLFSGMRDEEIEHVIQTVRGLCARHKRTQAIEAPPLKAEPDRCGTSPALRKGRRRAPIASAAASSRRRHADTPAANGKVG
jgi:perosamine synthetase